MATSIYDRLRQGVETSSAKETQKIARALGEALTPDATLALHGDLGSGKTTFVAGLAGAWNIMGPVTSPTFNLFTIYKGNRMLVHLDAYRLRNAGDMDALMIEEFLKSPWCMAVEWPENIEGWLPEGTLHIDLKNISKGRRSIKLRQGTA
jgi:tRNA threonylcarbamoyladenosine biosynthesis protein TsaE